MTNSLTFFQVTGYYYAVADPSISGNTNSPVVQPVNGLVTFTPRLPQGQQFPVASYLISAASSGTQTVYLINNPTGGTFTLSYGGYTTVALPYTAPANASVNDVQTVTLTGSPTGGTYTLTFGGNTTAAIAYNAPATGTNSVQAALGALSSINGTGNVTVTGSAGGPYTITFVSALANAPQSLLVATSSLTGGTTPTVSISHTTTGVTSVQSALQALTSIGSGNVTVSSNNAPQTYLLSFGGSLVNTAIQAVTGNADLLSNAQGLGFCEITVAVTNTGGPAVTASTAISLPPLTARIYNGVLSTIDYANTPGFQLVAETSVLGLPTGTHLIYDVTFSDVTFNGQSQYLAPFAFYASTDNTAVNLTDPTLAVLPYQQPSTVTWSPGDGLANVMSLSAKQQMPGNWRQSIPQAG